VHLHRIARTEWTGGAGDSGFDFLGTSYAGAGGLAPPFSRSLTTEAQLGLRSFSSILPRMGIKEDAVTLLVSLATYGNSPDDPNLGNYQFQSAELQEITGLTPNRLNDAADYLSARGLVKLLKALGRIRLISSSSISRPKVGLQRNNIRGHRRHTK
jgi:hypothetical protein